LNLDHRSFGQQYRLSGLAIRLREFTVSELVRLTGIVDDTVYGFVSKLLHGNQDYLTWEELPRETRGRPVKRYTLTDAGVQYLLQKNAWLAALINWEREVLEDAIPRRAAVPARVVAEELPAAASTTEFEVAEEDLGWRHNQTRTANS